MAFITVIFQSGKGHTRVLAEAVLKGVRQVPDVSGQIFEVAGKDVHEGRFANPALMEALDSSDGIVFGCATYMGSGSAIFKTFLEAAFAPHWLEQRWKDKMLRAYDVHSNAFSLNQAAVVFERAASPSAGSRWGTRLDLQFGQATASAQGSPSNEHRPDIYRNIFQAYGTYVFPVGSGLTVDFGKWASSLGYEDNYTKDQMNYSRFSLLSKLSGEPPKRA